MSPKPQAPSRKEYELCCTSDEDLAAKSLGLKA
jgi:hypothetical protein